MWRRAHEEWLVSAIQAQQRFWLALLASAALIALSASPAAMGASAADADEPDEIAEAIEEFIEAINQAHDNDDDDDRGRQTIELDEVEIFFEENATDGDLGVQVFLDGEDWSQMKVIMPSRRRLIDVRVKGAAREIGLTEFFTESAEPSFDDLPRAEFLALFPPGEYRFVGRTIEGDRLVGAATLTHLMPAQPVIVAPEEDDEVSAAAPLVIEWMSVADPDPPFSVIEAFQIVVEKDEEEERLRVFSIDMPSDATSVAVPAEFFEPGKDYKVEVIVIETSGNKTITEVPFTTAP